MGQVCGNTWLFSRRDLTQTLVSNRILEQAPAVTEGKLYIVKLLVSLKKLHLKCAITVLYFENCPWQLRVLKVIVCL